MWMDDGSGQYGRTGKSKYTQALMALIQEFVDARPERVDPSASISAAAPTAAS